LASTRGVPATARRSAAWVNGAGGGNRTPVRKPSAGSSTYLAMLFMFNFYFTNKQANIKASYLKFKKLLSSPIISESLFMTL